MNVYVVMGGVDAANARCTASSENYGRREGPGSAKMGHAVFACCVTSLQVVELHRCLHVQRLCPWVVLLGLSRAGIVAGCVLCRIVLRTRALRLEVQRRGCIWLVWNAICYCFCIVKLTDSAVGLLMDAGGTGFLAPYTGL